MGVEFNVCSEHLQHFLQKAPNTDKTGSVAVDFLQIKHPHHIFLDMKLYIKYRICDQYVE